MEYFDLLSEEITLDIISRLPTEDVLECKLVCTNWRSIVRRPLFSKMHFHRINHPAADSGKIGFIAFTYRIIDGRNNFAFQYFEYDENHESIERITRFNCNPPFGSNTCFLSSSNGLICLFERYEEYTYICNPITREYIMLPEIKKVRMDRWRSGFGYVSSTNEYKVVRTMSEKKTEFIQVYIYTLGSGHGWRDLGKLNCGSRDCYNDGIFVDGVLYWLDSELEVIIPFDLAEEKFCEHLSLPLPPNDVGGYYQLGVMNGCLSFGVDRDECWDVWLMKKKNDNQGIVEQKGHQSLSWSEVLRVCDGHLTKSYAVLTYYCNHINIQDFKASTSKTIVDRKEFFSGVHPHRNTLVSLKELGEESTKLMESVEIEETESNDQHFN